METLQRTANRGSVSTGVYEVANSCKFETDNSEFLTRDVSSTGSRTTATISIWLKRTELSTLQYIFEQGNTDNDDGRFFARFQTDDTLRIAGGSSVFLNTNRVFRDTSAWYHIVVTVNSTDSTADDRIKLYINGVQETSFGTRNNPSSSATLGLNFQKQTIGSSHVDSTGHFAGYMTEIVGLDGTASAQTSFGEFNSATGIWIPKSVSASGTNGFYLDFEDSSNMGNDVSGGTDFTENNIAAADQATDTCTNNFCTLNPLINFKYTTNGITEGGTVFGDNTGGGVGGAFGTMAVTAGKWYWEVKLTQQSSHYIGVSAIDDGDNVLSSTDPQEENSTFRFNINAARREYVNSGSQGYGSLDEFSDFHSAGDIIGIALNMDDNQISIYGNGTLQSGVANTTLYDAANKMVVPFHGTIDDECQYNFGGYSAWTPSRAVNEANGYGTFEYSPPSGYYALCTKNLAQYGG